jgi:hypothetical protein
MRLSILSPLASLTGAALLALAGCISPLDTLGNETQVSTSVSSNAPEDDRIEDKNPSYDPARIVVDDFQGCSVQLNKSASVAELDLVPLDGDARQLQGALFTGRGAAIERVDASAGDIDLIPSMEVVNGKLKPFNDGMYAAIELGVQEGLAEVLGSKRKLLLDLIAAMDARLPGATAAQAAHLDEARVFLGAAIVAGGDRALLSDALAAEAQTYADRFLANQAVARPIGFYTWSPALETVFRQDRYLQSHEPPFDDMFGAMAALAAVLAEEPALLAQYQQLLALYAGLTNPLVSYTPADIVPYVDGLAALDDLEPVRVAFLAEHPELFPCTPAYYAFLPASRSKDTEFYNKNWCLTGLPDGTSFMDAFIDAIRSGEVDLAPAGDGGWYDYQMWALETLLLPERGPESQHLLLTADYKQKLIDTFRSILTQNRETHVKQLAGGTLGGSGPVETKIYPLYPVEPFPTFYLRTARGYRFLRVYLEGVLGAAFLDGAGRLYEDTSRAEPSLAAELDQTIALLYGLYALSADSVGLDREAHLYEDELAEIDLAAAVAAARAWLDTWRTDRDVRSDPRVIVPVAADDGTGKGVYWAILGVEVVAAKAEYVKGFEPEVIPGGAFCDVTGIEPRHYLFLVERMEEVRFAGPPPTRDEFRAICTQHDSAEDIVKALESRQ